MFGINFNFLRGLNGPAPRYTSYPTIPEWSDCASPAPALEALYDLDNRKESPLSLYFHIPFCRTMCLYCACSVVLNRNPEVESRYVDTLMKEIDLVCEIIGTNRRVTQLHFGGGTPTKIAPKLFEKLFDKIVNSFRIDFSKELNIEIDPRTSLPGTTGDPKFLRSLGFNRVSLGIQDLDPKVQEAVRRRQTEHQSVSTYKEARSVGFESINMDFIYGLPKQTPQSFSQTIEKILQLCPDRIALFSFAKVPWVKRHQKAIKDQHLPDIEKKFRIYSESRKALTNAGYLPIGMDHFALPHDEMAKSFLDKTLIRNFQGYSLPLANDLIGFGMTATGFVGTTYLQNAKTLSEYENTINSQTLATRKYKILSKDDRIRKWVIHTIMCSFFVDKKIFSSLFGEDFDKYFASSSPRIIGMESAGLVHNSPESLTVTPLGEMFVRVIATAFDAYLLNKTDPITNLFSSSI
ncbi:oxygen-independent coproporphyrinogen III oxidase [Chlamydiifrater volucris]|uniref:oxygen-independent coproporphyrinogen III oxidase n=1 Tax=Chlamydiifrater volucris TaxID=2681470 RepID=UPI001BCDBA90|nr:oxygen-independent coproporphyrinogen III oxidase [Chlamydiifrater volucris]